MSLVEARPKRGAATKARELIARIAVGENVDFQRERDATAAASSSSAETKKKRKANAAKSSASEPKKKKKSKASADMATLAALPIWVAAEILTLLDLATVLALTEVSHSVRAVFRTPASAATLMPLVLATACDEHRIELAQDSADLAWGLLKGAFQFAWTHSSATDNCADCVAAKLPTRLELSKLHAGRCCKAMLHNTPAQRRAALIPALAAVNEELRSDSNLCNGFIAGTLRDRSLYEVAAVMKCTRHLFSISHIAYSHHHDALNSAMRRAKFADNLTWTAAANAAIADGDWDAYEEDSYDYGGYGGECWNCGRYGHYARDCWH